MRGRHHRDMSARPSAQAGGAQQQKAQDTSWQGRTSPRAGVKVGEGNRGKVEGAGGRRALHQEKANAFRAEPRENKVCVRRWPTWRTVRVCLVPEGGEGEVRLETRGPGLAAREPHSPPSGLEASGSGRREGWGASWRSPAVP